MEEKEDCWEGTCSQQLGAAASHLELCPILCASNWDEIRALAMGESGCSCRRGFQVILTQQGIL